jgi:excisionase family DNA binding protein
MQELENVYKVPEVAAWMRCSRASIYRLLNSGQLHSIKIGGTRVITHSQIVDFIDRRKAAE